MRELVLLSLLASGMIFPQILYHVGFNPSSPEFGLRFYFPIELGEITALADLKLNATFEGGNLLVENVLESDPIKLAIVDLESVGLYYGFLEPEYPMGVWKTDGGVWKLRIGRSWVVFSNGIEVWTDTGILGVFVRSDKWRFLVKPTEFLGIGFDRTSGPLLVFRYSDLEVSFWRSGFSFRLVGNSLSVSTVYDDGALDLSIGYMRSGDYLSVSSEGIEFVKRVGSVYVAGGFLEKEPYVSVEYPIQF